MGDGKISALRMHAILFASGLSLMSGVAMVGVLISGPGADLGFGTRTARVAVEAPAAMGSGMPDVWVASTECER